MNTIELPQPTTLPECVYALSALNSYAPIVGASFATRNVLSRALQAALVPTPSKINLAIAEVCDAERRERNARVATLLVSARIVLTVIQHIVESDCEPMVVEVSK